MRRLLVLLCALVPLGVSSSAAAASCAGEAGCPYTANGSFAVPVSISGLALDASGNLYATDPANQVYRFSPTGTLNGNWFSSNSASVPIGIAVSADGSRIFVVDNAGNQVLVFDGATPNTQETGTLAAGELNRPFGVGLDGTGVVVADTGNTRVLKLTEGGTVVDQARTLTEPRWPAVDPQGRTWVVGTPSGADADDAVPAIQQFTSALKPVSETTVPLEAVPQGAAVDSIGDLFVSDAASDLIFQYSSEGVLVNLFGGTGSAPGSFDGLQGIAIDGSDTLYAADSLNNRVQTFALAAAAQATAVGGGATVVGSTAPVEVSCLARGIATCEGGLTLRGGGKTLGREQYSIADDDSETVRVPLKQRAKRALKREGKLKATAFARTESRPGTQDRVTSERQKLRKRR
jgi:tripartite motif-containing protein 71